MKLKTFELQITNSQNDILNYETQIEEKQRENKEATQKLLKANKFIENFDLDKLSDSRKQYEDLTSQVDEVIDHLQENDAKISRAKKQVELLKEVPCGSEFSHCKFIHGAYEAQGKDSFTSDR